jgi:ABC-type sugar transport system ATPase subunit
MASVAFDQVNKRFRDTVALAGLTLDISDSEFLVLVGPSGSGKTTALRILAGLEALTSGHVWIGDRVVDEIAPRDRDVAMVFQDYGLYPEMTVFGNLAFGLRMRKVKRKEIERRVGSAADLLGLSDLLRRKPRELSGGQRQRVALGRALVREPKAFLMDEPLSNLDAKLRVQTRGEIRRLQIQTGTTTVYVTHDQVEAMTMGDRVAVLNEGNLEQVGDPATLYDRPANVFVAGFIGSPAMTFGHFSAEQRSGTVELMCGEVRLARRSEMDVPSVVVVGVRPEHTRLWKTDGGLLGPLRGRVEYFEALGRETLVGVVTGDETRFIVQVDGQFDVGIDDAIDFGLQPGRVYLFDPDSERMLGCV